MTEAQEQETLALLRRLTSYYGEKIIELLKAGNVTAAHMHAEQKSPRVEFMPEHGYKKPAGDERPFIGQVRHRDEVIASQKEIIENQDLRLQDNTRVIAELRQEIEALT